MSARSRYFAVLWLLVAAMLGPSPAVQAADPAGETVILVAKPELKHRLYGATILIAKPVANGQHVGFIINRPTQYTLGKLFPDHAPSQKVADPIFLGGPFNTGIIFALVQRSDSPGGKSVQLSPDLYLATEREVVDRIIETEPEHARFFAGLVVWRPGELAHELQQGLWYVRDTETDLVLRKQTEGLWEELVRRSEGRAI